MSSYTHKQTYALKFSDDEWNEIVSLGFEPFEIDIEDEFTRGQWMAIGEMALGKAQRIDEGAYGNDGDDDEVDVEEWADHLRGVASTIFNFFQPGDGKI